MNACSRSRGTLRPKFCRSFRPLNSEGAGNAGCALHPRSHVRIVLRKLHMSIQGSGEHPTFPAQWLYGLWRAHPGEFMAFVASVASRKPGPVGPSAPPQDLTPTSFRHRVHTLLPYAAASLVNTFQNRSRSLTALLSHSAHDAAASTATPVPTFGDDGQRPFIRDRMAGVIKVFRPSGKAKFYPTG